MAIQKNTRNNSKTASNGGVSFTHGQAMALMRQFARAEREDVFYTFMPQVEMSHEATCLREGKVSRFTPVTEHSVQTGSTADNYLIESDNLPALMGYVASGAPKADVIYIDPPYNRQKNNLTYADTKKAHKALTLGDDHAPWMSFMLPRLVLAREALRETGVIVVHIGRHEDAHAVMLLDRVFGRKNRLGQVTWAGGEHKGNARFVSNECDYMHIYARDRDALEAADPEFVGETVSGVVDDLKQRGATAELGAMLGKRPNGKAWFDYPKHRELLGRILPAVVPASRIAESEADPIRVMDFFAGSGATGHAVLDLDAREGQGWRFTLVTNNEGGEQNPNDGIARVATAKRMRAAVTGEWVRKTENTRTYDANVAFLTHGFTEVDDADPTVPWGQRNSKEYAATYRRLYALIVNEGDFIHDLDVVPDDITATLLNLGQVA